MRGPLVGCIVFFLGVQVVNAQVPRDVWGPEIRKYSKSFSFPFSDPYIGALWGTCEARSEAQDEYAFSVEETQVPIATFGAGGYPARLGLVRDENDQIVKAPLVVVFPGSFASLKGTQARRFLEVFLDHGYHIAMLPNPWAVDFLTGEPPFWAASVMDEASALLEGVRFFSKKLAEKGVLEGRARVLGVSSGAFLGAIAATLEGQSGEDLTEDYTLLAPPFDLGYGIEQLDQLIHESQGIYSVLPLWRVYWTAWSICSLDGDHEVEPHHIRDAKGVVVSEGFHRYLFQGLDYFYNLKPRQLPLCERLGFPCDSDEEMRRKVTFSMVLDFFNPNYKKFLKSEKGELMYWVQEAQVLGKRFRLLTTEDDFLNLPGDWDLYPDLVIKLPSSGHYGFRGSPWYEGFLKLAF